MIDVTEAAFTTPVVASSIAFSAVPVAVVSVKVMETFAAVLIASPDAPCLVTSKSCVSITLADVIAVTEDASSSPETLDSRTFKSDAVSAPVSVVAP